MADGVIFDIKEFAVHDGPGSRVTVFFKGCPLRCKWCHNPEGLLHKPELMIKQSSCTDCGKCKEGCSHELCSPFDRCVMACPRGLISIAGERVTSKDLADRLMGYKSFFEKNGGGVTISGGEPLAQPEFLIELLKELKDVNIAIETSGHGEKETFKKAIGLADLMLFDIKHMDTEAHKKYTGVGNEIIQENLKQLILSGRPFIARVPLVPGVNDTQKNLKQTAEILKGTENLQRVELLRYNPLAGAKYGMVSRKYDPGFEEERSINTDCSCFEKLGIRCKIL